MANSQKGFLKISQKKIKDLKKRLQKLSKKEEALEKEEKALLKQLNKPQQEVKVVLSVESVFKSAFAILAVVALVYLLVFIKDIIIIFLVALFLSAAFNPAVDKLEGYKIPRALGIIIMYTIVLGVLITMFTSLIPIIAEQITTIAISISNLITNLVNEPASDGFILKYFSPYINQFVENVDQSQLISGATDALKEVGSQLTGFAGNAIGAIFAIFNGLFNLVLVLIITFFMILNKQNTSDFFHSLFPHKYSAYISLKTKQISIRIGEWIRGQIILAFAMAILVWIIFTIIGLDFAITLAMVAAIGEFLPYLGPLITFFSALLIAINQDPLLVLWLFPAYAVIQFLEGNIMVPLIIGKSVGLNPIVILFALLSGATLGVQLGGSPALGLVGMIIAVPVANIISIFVEDYTEKNK